MSRFNITDSPYPADGSTPITTSSNLPLSQALAMSPTSTSSPPQYVNMLASSSSNTALPASTSNPQLFSVGNTVIGGSSSQPLVQLAVIVSIPSNAENPVGGGDEGKKDKGKKKLKIRIEPELRRNPCYTFGFSMHKGASVWAFINLTSAFLDLLFTFVHLLYVYRVIGFTPGYNKYFQLFHAIECPPSLKVDITLSYVGSIFNVMAACLLFYATRFVKDDKFRSRLCILFNHLVFVPLVFFLPRFIIGFYGGKQTGKGGSSCVLQTGNAATNFWVLNICMLLGFIVWFLYGFWVSDAFVRWLIISSEGNINKKDKKEKEQREKESGEWVDDEDIDI